MADYEKDGAKTYVCEKIIISLSFKTISDKIVHREMQYEIRNAAYVIL